MKIKLEKKVEIVIFIVFYFNLCTQNCLLVVSLVFPTTKRHRVDFNSVFIV